MENIRCNGCKKPFIKSALNEKGLCQVCASKDKDDNAAKISWQVPLFNDEDDERTKVRKKERMSQKEIEESNNMEETEYEEEYDDR